MLGVLQILLLNQLEKYKWGNNVSQDAFFQRGYIDPKTNKFVSESNLHINIREE